MNLIQLIACIGLITGCFVLLRISPMDFTEGVFRRITSKPKSIRSEVWQAAWTVRSWSSERALPVLPLPDWRCV